MKNILTRSELLEAKEAFWCNGWRKPIQDILDSSDDENIEIEDKYLDLIKKHATWDQILLCKALNLDLKMNLPQRAKDFVLEKIKACKVLFDENFTLYQENGTNIFGFDSKTKEFWFDLDLIYVVLIFKYSLKNNEVFELVVSTFKEHFKLNDFISLITIGIKWDYKRSYS